MKKALLLFGIVLVLAIGAVGIFIATFNADLYRPLVVRRLEEVLGAPVKLEGISLGWRGGAVLRLKKLAVTPQPKGIYAELSRRTEPSLRMDEIHLVVRLRPLLRRQIQIASIRLVRPGARLSRNEAGRFWLEGIPIPPAGNPAAVPGAPPAEPAPGTASPAAPAGSPPGAAGTLSFAVDRIHVEGGSLRLSDPASKPPAEWVIEQIALEAGLREERVDLKKFSGRIAQGQVSASGQAEGLKSEPRIRFQIAAEGLALPQLLPAQEGEPHLAGEFSGSFQGTVQGRTPEEMTRSLSGEGKVRVAKPVLVNMNILKEVFKRISVIPGLVEILQSRLPASYRGKLNSKDTPFELIDLAVKADQGAILAENLRLAGDAFALAGSGRLGLSDRAVFSRMQLKVGPELSAAVIQSVNELKALADPEGRIEFPVKAEGILPNVAVLPDPSYLASRLIVNKVEDLLGDLLEKALEKKKD